MPKMKILLNEEKDVFENPPVFSYAERKKYFDFDDNIIQISHKFRNPYHQILFLLQVGYFKAKKRFFSSTVYSEDDIRFIIRHFKQDKIEIYPTKLPETSERRFRKLIVAYYGYRTLDIAFEEKLFQFIAGMIVRQIKPKLIFWESVDWLIAHRIVVTSYFQLSDLILKSLKVHKEKLVATIQTEMTDEIKSLIDGLFEKEGEYRVSPYRLTLLKKFSQSTKPTQVKERCSDLVLLSSLFQKVLLFLEKLHLDGDGLRYFASAVIKSDIFQLNQRSEEDRYIHVIAFIAHQYYRLQDNLIDTLLSSINGFENSIKRQYKDSCYESRMQSIGSEQNLKLLLKNIKEVTESRLGANEKIIEITRLLGENSYDEDANKDELPYEDLLEKQAIRLQNRIAPIVKIIDFQSDKTTPLMEAISFFQKKEGIINKNAPLDFLKETERNSVIREGFRPSLYKIYLFLHIAQGMKSGQLNLQYSYKYRSLDGYLIDKGKWDRTKGMLIPQANLLKFQDPKTVIATLKEALWYRYQQINQPHKAFTQ